MEMEPSSKHFDHGLTWTPQEELELLDIWSDEAIRDQLAAGGRNRHIFLGVSREMMRRGCRRSADQCRHKIKRFKMLYFQAKKSKSKNKCLAFRHYKKVDEILALSKPAAKLNKWSKRYPIYDEEENDEDASNDNMDLEDDEGYSFGTAVTGPTPAWTSQELEVLLEIWQEPVIRDALASSAESLDSCSLVAEALSDNGFQRTSAECQAQLRKMKAAYLRSVRQREENPRSTDKFPYPEQMKKILSKSSSKLVRTGRIQYKKRSKEEMSSSSRDNDGGDMEEDVSQNIKQEAEDNMVDGSFNTAMVLDCQEIPGIEIDDESAWMKSENCLSQRRNWTAEEMETLVTEWVKPVIQERLHSKYRNTDVYGDIAKALKLAGFERSSEECRCKVNALRFSYRNAKPNSSFWRTCPQWAVFKDFQRILEDSANSTNSQNSSDKTNEKEAASEMSETGGNAECSDDYEDGSYQIDTEEGPAPNSSNSNNKGSSRNSNKGRFSEDGGTSGQQPGQSEKAQLLDCNSLLTSVEHMVDRALSMMLQYQKEAQERQIEWEERRLKLTLESEERRHKEQKEQELKLFEMMTRLITNNHNYCQNAPFTPVNHSHGQSSSTLTPNNHSHCQNNPILTSSNHSHCQNNPTGPFSRVAPNLNPAANIELRPANGPSNPTYTSM